MPPTAQAEPFVWQFWMLIVTTASSLILSVIAIGERMYTKRQERKDKKQDKQDIEDARQAMIREIVEKAEAEAQALAMQHAGRAEELRLESMQLANDLKQDQRDIAVAAQKHAFDTATTIVTKLDGVRAAADRAYTEANHANIKIADTNTKIVEAYTKITEMDKSLDARFKMFESMFQGSSSAPVTPPVIEEIQTVVKDTNEIVRSLQDANADKP